MKFELTSAEALVLFEFIARTNKNERLTIEDKSEQIVLWNLESILEKKLTEPLHKNYQELLKAARDEVNAI